MTVELAKQLCIEAHKGQWRRKREARKKEYIIGISSVAEILDEETYLLNSGSELTFVLNPTSIKAIIDHGDIPIASTYRGVDGIRIDYFIRKMSITENSKSNPTHPDFQIYTDYIELYEDDDMEDLESSLVVMLQKVGWDTNNLITQF